MTRKLQLLLLLLMFTVPVISQDTAAMASKRQLVNQYTSLLGMNVSLYNGPEYPYYMFKIHEGHPYFNTSAFSEGYISFEGIVYHNAWLLYDLIKDEVVVRHHKNYSSIQMHKSLVDSFRLHGRTFVHLNKLNTGISSIEAGYYEQLVQGNSRAFAKHTKTFQDQASGTDLLKVVHSRSSYYVLHNGKFEQVRSEGQLLGMLSDQRKDVQQFLRRGGLKFRKDRERTITEAVKYYNQLKQ